MGVAVIGAGKLGRAVQFALSLRGVPAQLHSRSTGFDVLLPDAGAHLGNIDVVVEATDIFTQDPETARDFFVRSTRAVNAAARAAGASKHILVSIVNCAKPELHGNGYYAGKAEQERVARAENVNLTIVRSTLWYEFARQNIERLRFGPFAVVPAMTTQPIALSAVADVVADCVVGERCGPGYDVAGPEVTTLWRMTKALPNKKVLALPVRAPGTAGRAFRDGALLPLPDVEVIGPRFVDWLLQEGS